jgi:hypothetical protein
VPVDTDSREYKNQYEKWMRFVLSCFVTREYERNTPRVNRVVPPLESSPAFANIACCMQRFGGCRKPTPAAIK